MCHFIHFWRIIQRTVEYDQERNNVGKKSTHFYINGREKYISLTFCWLCKDKKVIFEFTALYTLKHH